MHNLFNRLPIFNGLLIPPRDFCVQTFERSGFCCMCFLTSFSTRFVVVLFLNFYKNHLITHPFHQTINKNITPLYFVYLVFTLTAHTNTARLLHETLQANSHGQKQTKVGIKATTNGTYKKKNKNNRGKKKELQFQKHKKN